MRNWNVVCCMIVVLGYAFFGFSLLGRAQEPQPLELELLHVYQSSAEYHAAHSGVKVSKTIINDTGQYIKFFNAQDGRLIKKLQKEYAINSPDKEKQISLLTSNSEPIPVQTIEYDIYDNEFVMMTIRDELFYSEGFSRPGKVYQKVLYDSNGNKIAFLPDELNSIIQSPHKQSFIAFGDLEIPTKYLYFYSHDGRMLNKYEVNMYPNVNYSKNGEFVVVFDSVGHSFFISTHKGALLYEGNYTEFVSRGPLYAAFVSDDGKHFLLNAAKKVYLCTTEGKCIWELPSPLLYDCYFLSSKGMIILKSIDFDLSKKKLEDKFNAQFISFMNGKILHELTKLAEINFIGELLLIKKGGEFREYKIR